MKEMDPWHSLFDQQYAVTSTDGKPAPLPDLDDENALEELRARLAPLLLDIPEPEQFRPFSDSNATDTLFEHESRNAERSQILMDRERILRARTNEVDASENDGAHFLALPEGEIDLKS